MNALQTRKQLLIVESELNRAEMIGDIAALMAGVRAIADRARAYNTIATSAAALVTGLAAFRRGRTGEGAAKTSWLQKVLKTAGLVSNLWLAFRSLQRDREKS